MHNSFDLRSVTTSVLDASAVISVLGMSCASKIIEMLPLPSIVDEVKAEIRRWPDSGRPINVSDWGDLPLRNITVHSLLSEQADRFTELVVECQLGNGEAASLAFIKDRSDAVLICDDAKAVRDGQARDERLRAISTVRMLRYFHECANLTGDEVHTALVSSLRSSRLRVHEADFHWVSEVLKPSEMAEMASLRRLVRRHVST